MPDGFTDVTSQRKVTATGTSTIDFTTVIAPAGSRPGDQIVIQQFGLSVDADTLDDTALKTGFGRTVQEFAKNTNSTVTPANPDVVQLDGVRTLVYDQARTNGGAKLYFMFQRNAEIQINCEYIADQAGIEKGCAAVRGSVQAIPL